MITIKITNAREIVERERSRFIAKLASYFINIQARIEEELAREIKKSLEARNIQAVVSVVKDNYFSVIL